MEFKQEKMLTLQNSLGSPEPWAVPPPWQILVWERHPGVLHAWEDGTGPREVAVVYPVLKGGGLVATFSISLTSSADNNKYMQCFYVPYICSKHFTRILNLIFISTLEAGNIVPIF